MYHAKKARTFLLLFIMTVLMTGSVQLPEATLDHIKAEEKLVAEAEVSLSAKEEAALQQEMEAKLLSANHMLDQITTVYSAENAEVESEISRILTEVESILKENPKNFSDTREQYALSKERLNEYIKLMQGINDKMSSFEISEDMDMSETIGFSDEELRYFLKNAKKQGNLLIPEQFVDELATAITGTMEDYPVNEICALAVMSYESGYFTSYYAENYNNFGGMKKGDGSAYQFETITDGIVASVRCINSNMKGSNTICEINDTYCAPVDGDEYGWAKNVLSIMKTYRDALSEIVESEEQEK